MSRKPGKTAPFLWGATAGALVLAILGFSAGGWMTGYTAGELAAASADQAVISTLTPICVAQFRRDPKASASLKAMHAIDRWQRADYVSRNGWATMPGSTDGPNRGVAAACADVLVGSAA
ncbi:MAG TPA: hypothetical protein VFV84_03165 [Burkholderiales bacterium]|nr:hypothetical protein [Burkholderiales bacterium]